MTDQAWQASVGRWGDQLWALALVQTGDRATAQHALTQAFERVFHARTLPADAHAALIESLVQPRRQGVLRWGRQRDLPRAVRRISPTDRALLVLWLVQEADGHRLLAATRQTHHRLTERLAKALVPFLPPRDTARRTAAGRAAFAHWIGQQLGITPASLPSMPTDDTIPDWQAAAERARDLLAATVAQQRLPGTVRAAIETTLTAQADETPAWQQYAGWLAVALLVGAVVWVLRPGAGARADENTAQAPPTDVRTVVQDALDRWTTTPVSGTLHRRVWAIDPNIRNAPALVTDVWLDAHSARHRIETTHDGTLVEWQIGDGAAALHYAARPLYRTCRWGASTVATNRAALLFQVDAAQQQAARDARLQHGAYGRGYQMLQTALGAPDLRSWGTRTEGDTPVLLVGYNDPAAPQRQRVLVFDARTHALQAVRELAGGGTQTVAQDLWRVEHDEHVTTAVSTALPDRPRVQFDRTQILDPACLGLDDEHVLSLRMLVGTDGGWWLPVRLPPDIHAAALLTNDSVTSTLNWQYQPVNATAVFVGGERWLRIKAQQTFVNLDGSVTRGPWRVVFEHDGQSLRAQLCRPPATYVACSPDQPSIALEAQGWTEAQLLDLLDGFAPAGAPATWRTLDALFVDPRPLDPQMQQVLAQTLDAMAVPDGVVHSKLEMTQTPQPDLPVAIGPAQSPAEPIADANLLPPLLDPYAVPHAMVAPPRVVVTETAIMSKSVVAQMSATTALPDGTLLRAHVQDEENIVSYDGLGQTMSTHSLQDRGWLVQTMPLQVIERLHGFVRSVLAPTLRDGGDVWLLEQPTTVTDPYIYAPFWQRSAGIGSSPRYTERLWIDKHTHVLRRAEVVYTAPAGVETTVSGMNVVSWEVDRSAALQHLDLPPLPPDTLAYTYGPSGPAITSDVQSFMPPQRVLVWRDGFGVAWRSAANRPLDVLPSEQAQAFLKELLSITQYTGDQFAQLEAGGAIHSTRYRVGDGRVQFTVRQGSAPLMRAILRAQSLGYTDGTGWTKSRAVPVTIAGQERTAWLLQGDGAPVLVVEVDGVILHITSSEPGYVSNDLVNALSQTEWSDVAQWRGDP